MSNRLFSIPNYWKGVLQGDLGISYDTGRPVLDMILERYPMTIKLALAALLVAISISIPLGVLAGTNKNSLIDNFSSFFALIFRQISNFFTKNNTKFPNFLTKANLFLPSNLSSNLKFFKQLSFLLVRQGGEFKDIGNKTLLINQ